MTKAIKTKTKTIEKFSMVSRKLDYLFRVTYFFFVIFLLLDSEKPKRHVD